MKKMYSQKKKEEGNCLDANKVTTKIEDVDGKITDKANSHATSMSKNGSLRYMGHIVHIYKENFKEKIVHKQMLDTYNNIPYSFKFS